jgi:hypothetical protein
MSNVFVFLGGSCNPTTWRKDIAIPFLEKRHVTHFNPQVENWTPEFMDLENKMKSSCIVNYFHIDNQTRGTYSLVEISYLMGKGKNIVISMDDSVHGDSEIIDNDIKKARQKILEMQNFSQCKIYVGENSMAKALSYISRLNKRNSGNVVFMIPKRFNRERKCTFNFDDIDDQLPHLDELCEIAFYIGQCLRKYISLDDNRCGHHFNKKLPYLDIGKMKDKTANYITDMNRPRIYINSFLIKN